MICPHCNIGVKVDFKFGFNIRDVDTDADYIVEYRVAYENCPQCGKAILKIVRRGIDPSGGAMRIEEQVEWFAIPRGISRPVPSEVPHHYASDYIEAYNVLTISPKASAALNRRLLQRILREEFKIQEKDLFKEIDKFINLKDTPSYLAEAIDAIRHIGNFAAHPLKITNTGEIVDVEPGEAEWLLSVMDMMFEHAFVQPERLKQQKAQLNAKLQAIGKQPMNTPKP